MALVNAPNEDETDERNGDRDVDPQKQRRAFEPTGQDDEERARSNPRDVVRALAA